MTKWYLPVIILLTGCGSLVPLDYHFQSHPLETLQINSPRHTIRMAFMSHQYDHMVFDLQITNHSPDTLYFSPGDLRCFMSEKPMAREWEVSTDPSKPVNQVLARTPEQVLTMVERKAKAKAVVGATLLVIGAALVIDDISKDTRDASKSTWTERDAKQAVSRDVLVASTFMAADVVSSMEVGDRQEEHYLQYELFPAGFILPNESVRGKVFFPRTYWGSYFRIIVPLDDAHSIFDFTLERLTRKESVRK